MNLTNIDKIDTSRMLSLLLSFPEQFQRAWRIGEESEFDLHSRAFKNITFIGMGGSAIAGDLAISSVGDEIQIPMIVSRDYSIPRFIDAESLVFVLSYSGDTEESLSAYAQALERKATIVCITSGGMLKEWAIRDRCPVFTIPGGQPPRASLGYLFVPLLIALSRMGMIGDKKAELDETYHLLLKKVREYGPENPGNSAIQSSQQLLNKIPILYTTAGMMEVVGKRWKCQFNENSKIHAFVNQFPELNHNEIVGYEMLKDVFRRFQVIYLHDAGDYYRIQKRMEITRDIIREEHVSVMEFSTEGQSVLARLFSLIFLGDMISYYVAIGYGIDPTAIRKIQLLKEQLKKVK